MSNAHPPLEHLVASSNTSLESFELTRLNRVADLSKELRQILNEWIEAEIEARLARWILERRRAQTGREPAVAMDRTGEVFLPSPSVRLTAAPKLRSAMGLATIPSAPALDETNDNALATKRRNLSDAAVAALRALERAVLCQGEILTERVRHCTQAETPLAEARPSQRQAGELFEGSLRMIAADLPGENERASPAASPTASGGRRAPSGAMRLYRRRVPPAA